VVIVVAACAVPSKSTKQSEDGSQERPQAVSDASPPQESAAEHLRNPDESLTRFFSQPLDEIKKAPRHELQTMFNLAIQVGDSPISDPDDVIRRMEVILHFAPENRLAAVYKASALVRKGKNEEALKVLEPVRAKLRELPLIVVMREVDVLVRANALAEAEKDLRATEKAAPNYLEARFWLSRVIYAQGRTDEAETRLKEDLKVFPKFAGGMILLGEISEKKGKLKDAEEYYLQAEPFIKDSPLVAEKLARLYVKMGNRARARVFLKEYREHRAADPKVTEELTRLVK
jgi:predicted Zn-dependent protease